MTTPEFIRQIRASAGNQLLLLPGVTAIVFDDHGRVLLGRRSDTGRWSVVGGIAEPGEQPAQTAVREVYEETAVHCVPERVVLVQMLEPITYPNGDACQFQDITFRCRATGGEARVNDSESLEVAWFEVDALPELEPFAVDRILRARTEDPTWFAPAAGPAGETAPAVEGAEALRAELERTRAERDAALGDLARLRIQVESLKGASEATEASWSRIDHLILGGRRIQAVQKIREEFGSSLPEAAELLDNRCGRLRQERPDDFHTDGVGRAGDEGVGQPADTAASR